MENGGVLSRNRGESKAGRSEPKETRKGKRMKNQKKRKNPASPDSIGSGPLSKINNQIHIRIIVIVRSSWDFLKLVSQPDVLKRKE
jgi:hypothetical protein